MQVRWVLTQFYEDDDGHVVPVASDYGGKWMCPSNTSTPAPAGWALVQVYLNQNHINAMASDSRVLVCPLMFDPRPISDTLLSLYSALGATSDMSFSTLLSTLADAQPHFGFAI